ncbi:hypothetical protein HQ393_09340 [Chitinibacter bivalviorum]|uniref:Uncharacterized protein n=1 Tax=Chitinibacter bivalviorum TaxID=2739434 RepID=A0A7H9BM34_9NEIS|nr:hypothetical protein [Chitinibacter bivalviorum]QLG88434.1 hypothetical protein HQ393_09340 [Chitinibacter bivalviorum]
MASAALLLGLFVIVAMQIMIFFIALSQSPSKALMCLVFPFYVYFYAGKDPKAKPYLNAWYVGAALLLIGTIAMN